MNVEIDGVPLLKICFKCYIDKLKELGLQNFAEDNS